MLLNLTYYSHRMIVLLIGAFNQANTTVQNTGLEKLPSRPGSNISQLPYAVVQTLPCYKDSSKENVICQRNYIKHTRPLTQVIDAASIFTILNGANQWEVHCTAAL